MNVMNKKIVLALLALLPMALVIAADKKVDTKQQKKRARRKYSAEDIKKQRAHDAKASLKEAKKKAKAAADKVRANKKTKVTKGVTTQTSGMISAHDAAGPKPPLKTLPPLPSDPAAVGGIADDFTQATVESIVAMEQAMSEMAKAKTPEELQAAQATAQEAAHVANQLGQAEKMAEVAEDGNEAAENKLEEIAQEITKVTG